MTAEQLVKQLEEHWDKELKNVQRQAYLRKLRRFSDDELGKIFEILIEEYTYLPRISQIYKIALEDLQISNQPEKTLFNRASWLSQGCAECNYSTWLVVTCHQPVTGEPYDAVEPCACTPRRKLTRENAAPPDRDDLGPDRIPF